MSQLLEKLQQDLKQAIREGDGQVRDTLRLLISEARKQDEVSDEDVINLLVKERKQREESTEQFRLGGREDLAEQALSEKTIIERYLPVQLSDEEVEIAINQAITETAAASIRDMGKVMAILQVKLRGQADMKQVSAQVKARLN